MPIYEYRCRDCGTIFETLVRGEVTKCVRCGSISLDKLLSVPAVLSAATARPAGHTCCGRDERCDAPPCSTGGPCRHE
jgi:putative FmdB family regulatory protein